MSKENPLDQARYIFTRGKMIHDRVQRILATHLSSDRSHCGFRELSVAQMHAFLSVFRRGEVTITELAERLGVAPPSASAMVDRLVEKGILTRELSTTDRRKVSVRVAPEAMQDIEEVEEAVLRTFVDLVEKIGPVTARKWCEVLERVKAVLEQETGSTDKLGMHSDKR